MIPHEARIGALIGYQSARRFVCVASEAASIRKSSWKPITDMAINLIANRPGTCKAAVILDFMRMRIQQNSAKLPAPPQNGAHHESLAFDPRNAG